MVNVISFPVDKSKNSKIKILNVYNDDMKSFYTSIYFGDDWEEDLIRTRKELGSDYHYILTEGVYV